MKRADLPPRPERPALVRHEVSRGRAEDGYDGYDDDVDEALEEPATPLRSASTSS